MRHLAMASKLLENKNIYIQINEKKYSSEEISAHIFVTHNCRSKVIFKQTINCIFALPKWANTMNKYKSSR